MQVYCLFISLLAPAFCAGAAVPAAMQTQTQATETAVVDAASTTARPIVVHPLAAMPRNNLEHGLFGDVWRMPAPNKKSAETSQSGLGKSAQNNGNIIADKVSMRGPDYPRSLQLVATQYFRHRHYRHHHQHRDGHHPALTSEVHPHSLHRVFEESSLSTMTAASAPGLAKRAYPTVEAHARTHPTGIHEHAAAPSPASVRFHGHTHPTVGAHEQPHPTGIHEHAPAPAPASDVYEHHEHAHGDHMDHHHHHEHHVHHHHGDDKTGLGGDSKDMPARHGKYVEPVADEHGDEVRRPLPNGKRDGALELWSMRGYQGYRGVFGRHLNRCDTVDTFTYGHVGFGKSAMTRQKNACCLVFTARGCNGHSLMISGKVPSLESYDMDDKIKSVFCMTEDTCEQYYRGELWRTNDSQ